MTPHRTLELLAPARSADIAIIAIDHGADAVYIGPPHHGARQAAGNSLADIARVVDYAHRFNARVYVTLNTLVYDNEIDEVKKLINDLYRIGVDALIVQDMAIAVMDDTPPIALHASTQCDIRTPLKARFLQDAGFSQLVLARELTLDEIKQVRQATSVPLEAFVHGALCVSYSGNCQVSYVVTGRSANRGECAQMCRLPYNLIDGDGKCVVTAKHLLSLRDMNRLDRLQEMIEAGVDSFKIEGRLKDAEYVKNVVSTYSRRLNEIVENCSNGTLKRRSRGTVNYTFKPSLDESFNRGFTDYFLRNRQPLSKMASIDTPKSTGRAIGSVTSCKGNTIKARLISPLNNGDGLTYFDSNGTLRGFRANRVDRDTIYLTSPISIKPGTTLFRNSDVQRHSLMAQKTARRVIDVDMTLRPTASVTTIALDITISGEPFTSASATLQLEHQPEKAKRNQLDTRRDVISKLGDTTFRLNMLDDRLPADAFIPISAIATLRRTAVDTLESALKASYSFERRAPMAGPVLSQPALLYNDNVANKLSAEFYKQAGATTIEPALECNLPHKPLRVMLTRYCIRRELGYCLKTPQGSNLKAPLRLQGNGFDLDVKFDCKNCEMSLYTTR